MDAFLRRLVGSIKVSERNDLVYVSGVATEPILNAIYKVWNTSKIEDYMFTHISSSGFTFNKFFVPDVLYSLRTILEKKPRGVNVRSVQKIIEQLKTSTWFSSAFHEFIPFLNRENAKNLVYQALPHQAEFIDRYERCIQQYHLEGYLLAADPGAGKTFTGLLLGELVESDVNIFIVPKNSLELVWEKSFKTLYKKPTSFWVSTGGHEIDKGCRNYAFHYERLSDVIEFVKKNDFKNPMLWLDESHNLNEMGSMRSQLFLELRAALKPKHVVWASGTPIKAMGREVIPLLKSIDPHFNKDAEERFTQIFGKASSRALDILHNRIGLVMHRTTKAEFRDNKPITKDIKVSMPNGDTYALTNVREVLKKFVAERIDYYQKNMKQYVDRYNHALDVFSHTLRSRQDKDDFIKYKQYITKIRGGYDPKTMKELAMFCNRYELKTVVPNLPQPLREGFKDSRTVVKYFLLKVNGEALGRVLGKMREQCIVDMVKHADLPDLIDSAEKKTVVFSTFVSAIKEAEIVLKKEGYHSMLVYGETNKDLNSIVSTFEKNEDINPLLATYASLSTAVPLVMANVCIMLNMPFREHIYKQAISRVDRIGQDTQVYLYNLYLDTGTESNLSTRAGDILEWCKEQVEQIIGKPVDFDESESVAMEDYSVSMECYDDKEAIIPKPSILSKW